MSSYKKILIFFKKLNIHRNYKYNYKQKPEFLFCFRNTKLIFNLNKILSSLYNIIRLVQQVNLNGGTILLVGNISIKPLFYFFKTESVTNILFTRFWISGLISNWGTCQAFFNSNSRKVFCKSSHKLQFMSLFYNFFKLSPPSLVIIIHNKFSQTIVNECATINIPVIAMQSGVLQPSYSLNVNSDSSNYFMNLVLFQLLFNQTNKKKLININN